MNGRTWRGAVDHRVQKEVGSIRFQAALPSKLTQATGILTAVWFAAFSIGLLWAPVGNAQSQRRPLEPADIADFKRIGTTLLTPDGQWLAYTVQPDTSGVGMLKNMESEFRHVELNRDVTVVLRSTRDDTERRYPAGAPMMASLTLSGDGQWMAFAATDAAGSAPSLRLVHVPEDAVTELPGIAEHRWLGANEDVLLLKHGPAEGAYRLSLQRAPRMPVASFHGVVQHVVSADGTRMVFQDARGLSLYRVDDDAGELLDTRVGCSYQGWQWSPSDTALAVQRQCGDEAGWSLVTITGLGTSRPRTTVLAASDMKGFPGGYDLAVGPGSLQWRLDEGGLFFQIQPQAEPKQTYPVADGVVLWHSADGVEPPNRLRIEKSPVRYWTYLDTVDQHVVRLADDSLRDVQPHPEGGYVLGYDMRSYEPFNSKGGGNKNQLRDYYLVELQSGERATLVKGLQVDIRSSRPQVMLSPKGDMVLYQDNARDYLRYDIAQGKTVNLTKGLTTHFYHEENRLRDGKGWFVVREFPAMGLQGWTVDGRDALISDGYDVWALPLHGGKAQNLTGNGRERLISYEIGLKGMGFVYGVPLVDVDLDLPLYFRASDFRSGKEGLALRTPGQAGVTLLNEAFSYVTYLRAPDADVWVYQRESFSEFPDWHLLGRDFQPVKRLTDAQPRHRELEMTSGVKWLTFQTSRGDLRGAGLLLPADYQPGKRYPAIVDIYLTQGFWKIYNPLSKAAIRDGYAILMPDIVPRIDEPGDAALETVVAAVDAAVASGVVDRDRLGLTGHSYGGFETFYVATQTDLFKAAIPNAGLTNLWSDFGKLYGKTWLNSSFGFGTSQPFITEPWWVTWNTYLENSPLYHARNLKTPLLIIHGDEDDAVPFEQGMEMFSSLWRMGNPNVVLLQYEGKNHHPERDWGPAAYDDMRMRERQFFAHFLKGEPAPDWWSGRTSYPSGRTPAVTKAMPASSNRDAEKDAAQGAVD